MHTYQMRHISTQFQPSNNPGKWFGLGLEFAAAAPENGFFQHRQRTAHFGSRDIILSPLARGHAGGGPPLIRPWSTSIHTGGRCTMGSSYHAFTTVQKHALWYARSIPDSYYFFSPGGLRREEMLGIAAAGWGVCLQHLNKSVTIGSSFNSGLFVWFRIVDYLLSFFCDN